MTALGVALIIVAALVLLLAEAHMSTGGLIATVAGLAAVGGIVLLLVAGGAGAAVVLVVALCALALAMMAMLLWRRRILRPLGTRPRTGREALVGHVGVVRSSSGPEAQVFIDGSLWRAEPYPGQRGQRVARWREGGRRARQRVDLAGAQGRGMGAASMTVTIVLTVLAVLLVIGLILVAASVRVLREYERAVVFRLGRLLDQKGPGVVLLIPFVDRMVRVSLRTVTQQIPPQEVITRDNVPARVTAVTYFHVVDPNKSVVEVEDVLAATSQIAQTTLRSVLGKAELDALLSERERLNEDLQKIIDDQTEPWGIKVTAVEIKDVEIPEDMQSRDRAAGRGRARAPGEDHQRRRRGAGRREARRGGRRDQPQSRDDPIALPADAARDRQRAELDRSSSRCRSI